MSSISRTMIRLLVVLLFLAGRAFAATALGSVTITGTEQSSGSTWDTGTVTATLNGVAVSFAYGQFSTPGAIASALGALISQKCNMPVYAQATGATLTFYQKGSNTITSASIASVSNNPSLFPNGSFLIDGGSSWSGQSSTTTLTSTQNPSSYGGSVTFTATVTPGSPTPTGQVTFYDGSSQIGTPQTLDSSRTATYSTSNLGVGTHSITATYSGGSNYIGSTSSPALNQVVGPAAPSTTLSSINSNPSSYGDPVTFKATVSPTPSGPPYGTVTFNDANGTLTLGTGTLNSSGEATLTLRSLAPGSHSITATYSGDPNSTSAVFAWTVNRRSMTIPSYCVH
jgi:hypothetical protein